MFLGSWAGGKNLPAHDPFLVVRQARVVLLRGYDVYYAVKASF